MSKVTLTGEKVRIYSKEKTYSGGTFYTYSMGVSSKDANGDWVNGFLDVQFKKGVVIPNKTDINIKNAFPTVREYNGKSYVSWFIMDYEIVSEGQSANASPDMGFINVPQGLDEDLPFARPSR